MEAYLVHLFILVCIYFILAASLQLAMGFGGLLNLGHIAFYGIGAYASALLTLNLGVSFWVALPLAGVCAMLGGFLISLPTNKLKGDYLALATMGFSFIVYALMLNWTELTRGPLGIPGIARPQFFGISLIDNNAYLIFALLVAALCWWLIKRIVESPFGRLLEAIRDDELAAQILGKRTARMKTIALGTSAFFAGIAGSMYAHYINFIDPSSFMLLQIIPVLSIVIIGGLASLRGTVIASVILILLPEPLRFIGFPSSIIGPMRQIIYALFLLLILLYRPKGISGKVQL